MNVTILKSIRGEYQKASQFSLYDYICKKQQGEEDIFTCFKIISRAADHDILYCIVYP